MMNVVDDHLVIEEKEFNSVEKILMSRRLDGHKPIYTHKTSRSGRVNFGCENLKRATKNYTLKGIPLCSEPLLFFLQKQK
jgi:HD superfamily phosphohydrolase